METTTKKEELVEWLKNVDDEWTLLRVQAIKAHTEFDFDTAFKEGMTTEEFRAEMHKRIDNFEKRK
ncbi:MAG: hypothetical protein AAF688_11495 [Bacteroidota bacterium]